MDAAASIALRSRLYCSANRENAVGRKIFNASVLDIPILKMTYTQGQSLNELLHSAEGLGDAIDWLRQNDAIFSTAWHTARADPAITDRHQIAAMLVLFAWHVRTQVMPQLIDALSALHDMRIQSEGMKFGHLQRPNQPTQPVEPVQPERADTGSGSDGQQSVR